jgi:hypothetical protein
VPEERIELSTYPLPRGCATTTLLRLTVPADAGARCYSPRVEGGKGPVKAPSSDRKDRLAAALRENLKRRKARDRALKEQPEPHEREAVTAPDARPNAAQNKG